MYLYYIIFQIHQLFYESKKIKIAYKYDRNEQYFNFQKIEYTTSKIIFLPHNVSY